MAEVKAVHIKGVTFMGVGDSKRKEKNPLPGNC